MIMQLLKGSSLVLQNKKLFTSRKGRKEKMEGRSKN
jgi:hypothetical protein